MIWSRSRSRISGSVTPRPSSGASTSTPSLPSCRLWCTWLTASATSSNGNTAESVGMDPALADEPVRLPRLAVVREVAALERLLVHPEVAVVVLDHEAARRRARDDGAAARAHEHRRAHRRAPRVLEHDVGVAADELADPLAEPSPLGRVLGAARPSRTGSPRPCGRSRARRPVSWSSAARSGLDTTPTGVPPPLSTYWHAYAPIPPLAPQISTVWPCVICAPFGLTSIR